MRRFSRERLAEELSDKRFNISAIAEMTGLAPQYLQKLKKKQSNPSADTLVRLADVLKRPMDFFFVEVNCEQKV